MKTFDLNAAATTSPEGEAIFGLEQTGSHACYMVYGILKPGEKERLVKPGRGHEELVLAAAGDLHVTGCFTGVLKEGLAFHVAGESECRLENRGDSDAWYVIAGGHSEAGHH